jgi:hypothetical protein
MREFSKISPRIWRDKQFLSLTSSDAKLALFYFIASEHQNSSGCCRILDGYASADLGWEVDRYLSSRQELVRAGSIHFDDETSELFIDGWFQTNPPMNPKHGQFISRRISEVESDRIREVAESAFVECEETKRPPPELSMRPSLMAVGGSSLTETSYMRRRQA